MSTAVAPIQNGASAPDIMHDVITKGDLSQLTPDQQARYYAATCESLGLNPLTKPFDYLDLPGRANEPAKRILYCNRGGTDQLRQINRISLEVVNRETVDGVYVVTVRATTPDGRTDESTGAVSLVREDGEWVDVVGKDGKKVEDGKWPNGAIKYKRRFESNGQQLPLSPDDRANALMKAETKAKRRATLSVCGLGWLDESEIETIPSAKRVAGPEIVVHDNMPVNAETGEIVEPEDMPQDAPPDDGSQTSNPYLRSIEEAANKQALEAVAQEIRSDTTVSSDERETLVKAYVAKQEALGLKPAALTAK